MSSRSRLGYHIYNSAACADCASKCSKQGEGGGHRHHVRMAEADFSKEYDKGNLAVRQVRVKADKARQANASR